MRLGLVVDGTDHFIKPVEAAWRQQHEVTRFEPSFVRLPLVGARVNEFRLTRQLNQFLKAQDVVFFEWAASLLIRATQLPSQGRIVTRMHSVELATSVEQVNWRHVNHLIVLNNALRQRFTQLVAPPLPPTTIVANGVDLTAYQPVYHPFNYQIGMVCNLLPIKRVYEMILAIYQLRQDGYPYKLKIAGQVGAGEARRYGWALESLVAKLDLSEVVLFSGFVKDVPAWLQDVNIFVSNSYWEGQQMGLIEAMAGGCYCLSHCWDGVEEILPSVNIFVTDSDLQAKLIAYASSSDSEKQEAQTNMRKIVEAKFDQQRMISELTAIIQSAKTASRKMPAL